MGERDLNRVSSYSGALLQLASVYQKARYSFFAVAIGCALLWRGLLLGLVRCCSIGQAR